jgi:argininosuccinate lyase
MTGMVADMTPDIAAMRAAAGAGYSTATDLADWLVREAGLPFSEAHHVTGRIVAEAEKRGVALEELPLEAMQKVHPKIGKAIHGVLSVEASVASRTSQGGTAPKNVRAAARAWLKRLAAEPRRQNRSA